jgi:hypothetical protein
LGERGVRNLDVWVRVGTQEMGIGVEFNVLVDWAIGEGALYFLYNNFESKLVSFMGPERL